MSRDLPRRPKPSRTPTSRPRKLAGQGSATTSEPRPFEPAPVVEKAQQGSRNPGALTESRPSSDSPGFETGAERPPQPAAGDESSAERGLSDLFDSSRATSVLVSLVVVLAVAAGGLFAWDGSRDDSAKPSEQPVVVDGDDATAAVDAAAKAAQTILTRSYKDYDRQVDDATALMTDAFAKEFRQTTDDVKDEFVAAKTDQQVRVVGQGVVHATRTEVQALLFLNYYVSKDGGDTTYTAYRALVTAVHTDRGWLVSGIDTK